MDKFTEVFWWNVKAKTRFVVNQGGTGSSKTWSILQLLILIAQKHPNILISIVAESLPHLRRGAMRDFLKILHEENAYFPECHNMSENSYSFGSGIVEFFGADDASKLRGARRDYLFINEANNISISAFEQLEVRTKERIYIDYNPVAEFWAHTDLLSRPEVSFIKSTYRNNKYLDEKIRHSIEERRTRPGAENWWRVFGEGELGVAEDAVLTNWDTVQEFPNDCKWTCLGMDFGYANDPTAIVRIGLKEGQLYIHQLLYERGLTNPDIASRLRGIKEEIFCDAAEPKSIEELYRLGLNVKAAEKGADSVNIGLDVLRRFKLHVTNESVDLLKELRSYTYKKDRLGAIVRDSHGRQMPSDHWNHAIDATRYAARMKCRRETTRASWMDDLLKEI